MRKKSKGQEDKKNWDESGFGGKHRRTRKKPSTKGHIKRERSREKKHRGHSWTEIRVRLKKKSVPKKRGREPGRKDRSTKKTIRLRGTVRNGEPQLWEMAKLQSTHAHKGGVPKMGKKREPLMRIPNAAKRL